MLFVHLVKIAILNGPIPASFCLFSSFPHYIIQKIDESVDGVLGTWTRDSRMEGADEFIELWRHPKIAIFLLM